MSIPSGHGFIHAQVLPPNRLTLSTLNFKYPLKLISPSPTQTKCLTVFMLSYGGGLVSGDSINLKAIVETGAKLCLQTQGSTKVFKHDLKTPFTRQELHITVHPDSTLLLIPDPVQPFAQSAYIQKQVFHVSDRSSVVVLDWVTEGRAALGEKWSMKRFESRNEFYNAGRLLLRDALILEGDDLCERQDGLCIFATLIVRGIVFEKLIKYIQKRYQDEPRIGGKRWDDEEEQKATKVLWTVSMVRGFLLVKVSGVHIEDVKDFIRELLDENSQETGTITELFGPGCLRCLQ